MNYIEWNNALAKRYFDDVTEAQTFLCITRDTLKDISALATEQAALDDFIAAVKNGPEWTQIDGCGTIPSKAHNCLYPDLYWSRLRTDSREKHNLAGHVGWRGWKWEGKTLQHPPYLAYLLLLVLSWTERGEADHGGQFYNPLNRILGLEGDKRIESKHLGAAARYKYNNAIITFNDMWQDLEKWSWEDRVTCPQSWDTSKLKFRWYWLVDVVDGFWVDCNPGRREAVGRPERRVVAATVLTGS
jgi:hypothetical protein